MRWQSTHRTHPLRFHLGGKLYQVPVGETVDIPDHWESLIIRRRIPLVQVPETIAREVSKEEAARFLGLDVPEFEQLLNSPTHDLFGEPIPAAEPKELELPPVDKPKKRSRKKKT